MEIWVVFEPEAELSCPVFTPHPTQHGVPLPTCGRATLHPYHTHLPRGNPVISPECDLVVYDCKTGKSKLSIWVKKNLFRMALLK